MKAPIISTQEITAPWEKQQKAKADTTRNLLKAFQQRWRDHRESVRGSYELYYGQGTSTGRPLGNPFVAPKEI